MRRRGCDKTQLSSTGLCWSLLPRTKYGDERRLYGSFPRFGVLPCGLTSSMPSIQVVGEDTEAGPVQRKKSQRKTLLSSVRQFEQKHCGLHASRFADTGHAAAVH